MTYSTVNLKAEDSFAYLGSYGVAASSLPSSSLNDYLHGDRSLQGASYRVRTGLMGAVINAEPVVSTADGMVYATSNDGMLHALDKVTGEELWAYVPSFGLQDMTDLSAKGAVFKTVLDGTPVLAKAGTKTVLVGGRGTAGAGYYALDVTSPKADKNDSDLAKRVLWEFPNSSTTSDVRSMLGASEASFETATGSTTADSGLAQISAGVKATAWSSMFMAATSRATCGASTWPSPPARPTR